MSMSVVKSEHSSQSLSFNGVEALASELNIITPVLEPCSPMPSGFRKTWEDTQDRLEETVYENKDESHRKIARALKRRNLLGNHFLSWCSSSKHENIAGFTSAGTGVLVGAGIPVAMAVSGGLSLDFLSVGLWGGIFLGTVIGALPMAVMSSLMNLRSKEVLQPIVKTFSAGYEQRVIEWAQERYGVTIPAGAWASPTDRVSKDIVYLGVKDGEGVYCFETEAGWVLGHRDGTELPVLAGQKELVSA